MKEAFRLSTLFAVLKRGIALMLVAITIFVSFDVYVMAETDYSNNLIYTPNHKISYNKPIT